MKKRYYSALVVAILLLFSIVQLLSTYTFASTATAGIDKNNFKEHLQEKITVISNINSYKYVIRTKGIILKQGKCNTARCDIKFSIPFRTSAQLLLYANSSQPFHTFPLYIDTLPIYITQINKYKIPQMFITDNSIDLKAEQVTRLGGIIENVNTGELIVKDMKGKEIAKASLQKGHFLFVFDKHLKKGLYKVIGKGGRFSPDETLFYINTSDDVTPPDIVSLAIITGGKIAKDTLFYSSKSNQNIKMVLKVADDTKVTGVRVVLNGEPLIYNTFNKGAGMLSIQLNPLYLPQQGVLEIFVYDKYKHFTYRSLNIYDTYKPVADTFALSLFSPLSQIFTHSVSLSLPVQVNTFVIGGLLEGDIKQIQDIEIRYANEILPLYKTTPRKFVSILHTKTGKQRLQIMIKTQKEPILVTINLISPVSFIKLYPQSKIYKINDTYFLSDVAPYIDENNRTLVPLRFIAEALGSKVKWISKKKQVIISNGEKRIVLYIGKRQFEEYINNKKKVIVMDTAPRIRNGRTLVPLRFIAEALGITVKWLSDEHAILLIYKQ